eukprot:m.133026 g.133026  ORF g.133026 m.133026 type:complete len:85 (+) comp17522_c0_seq3:312-566(+)
MMGKPWPKDAWYVECASREEAEKLLHGNEHGTFLLVRCMAKIVHLMPASNYFLISVRDESSQESLFCGPRVSLTCPRQTFGFST